jgi:hypothetical protein
MSVERDCLHNIIGLSETVCDCFDDGKPADYNESESGIFLDQLDGLDLNTVNAISDCAQGGLWDIMLKSRENGIKAFKADVLGLLLTKYKPKRKPFSGVIGSSSGKNFLSLNTDFAGERIYCANIIGGVMVIKRIGVFMDSDATFDIEVRNELGDSPIETRTVSSQANKLTWNDVPDIELPMNLETNDNPNYFITYPTAGLKPKDTTNGCGCSQNIYKYYWSLQRPMFKTFQKDRWSEYIMITGITGNDLADVENFDTSEKNYGLFFDVEFKCATSDLICNEAINYESNGVALAMAYAIRYKAGFLLIDSLLASGNISRYTMMDRERLMQKKNTYNKEYQDRIQWITDQINYQANDCLVCNHFDDIRKVGILA